MQRSFFPRAPWRGVLAIIFAGVIADVDWFSASFAPADYFLWHRTATHSVAFAALLAFVAFLLALATRGKAVSANWGNFRWRAVAAAASLHVLMDLTQADSVAPLWPFSAKRFCGRASGG